MNRVLPLSGNGEFRMLPALPTIGDLSGQPWQESIVAIGFLTVTIAIIATSILVLWGLRGTAAEVNDGWRHSDSTFRERRKDADHEPGDRAALDAQSSGSIARQQTLA